MRKAVFAGLVVALLGVPVLSCSGKKEAAERYFADDELGVEIDDFDWANPPKGQNEAGVEQYEEDAEVTLADRGTHTVLVEYWVEIEDNGDDTNVEILVVTDKTLGQVREYRFDPTATSFGIAEADGEAEVEIVKNPDGSYTVDGEPVANGKAAVALLKEYPVYADASPWGIITAYAVCQTCLERAATRQPVCCVNCGGTGPTSDEVAICDVFPDLCACIACDKLNKEDCSLCP